VASAGETSSLRPASGRQYPLSPPSAVQGQRAEPGSPGAPSLMNFHDGQPPLRQGMHFNLYNNVWGTNFPMWWEGDFKARFQIRISAR
jgi:hypothetical protein